MASEKKTETPKTETPKHTEKEIADFKEAMAQEDPTASDEGVMHLERIAVALERLADAFAPRRDNTAPGRPMGRRCEKGHGMQPTDDYCQTCYADRRGGATMREVSLDELRGAKLPDEAA